MIISGRRGNYKTVTHHITYEVADCHGNGPVIKTEEIVVTPRPEIIKTDY